MPKIIYQAFTFLSLLVQFTPIVNAIVSITYQLDTQYSGSSFFDGFDFFTGSDPTNGFVTYVDASNAVDLGLTSIEKDGTAYIGVDHESFLSPNGAGRKSVRITSLKRWTHGLVVVDLAHMPGSVCGTWPAMWMLGPNWPNGGEIDIIEGVNSNQQDLISLHTSSNCTMPGASQLGTLQTSDCDANVNGNSGCGVTAPSTSSYGTGFNSIGGGVYATEWTSQYIRIWFFPRSSIPKNILSGSPDPSNWDLPQANFEGSCDIDSHFEEMQIVFDNTFCGDWAGSAWSLDSTCVQLGGNECVNYVAENPGAFLDSYWGVNSVAVYTLGVESATSTSSRAVPSSSSKSSSVVLISATLTPSPTSSSSSSKQSITTTSILSSSPSTKQSSTTTNPISSPLSKKISSTSTSSSSNQLTRTTSSKSSSSIKHSDSPSALAVSNHKAMHANLNFPRSSSKLGACTRSIASSSTKKLPSSPPPNPSSKHHHSHGGTLATSSHRHLSLKPKNSIYHRLTHSHTKSSPSIYHSTSKTKPSNNPSRSISIFSGIQPILPSLIPLPIQIDPNLSTCTDIPAVQNPFFLLPFTLLGCLSTTSPLVSSFTEVRSSDSMTLNSCLSTCTNYIYAGVYSQQCFCGNQTIDLQGLELEGDGDGDGDGDGEGCDIPCPGDASQICGGDGNMQVEGKALGIRGLLGGDGVRLTVYVNLNHLLLDADLEETTSGIAVPTSSRKREVAIGGNAVPTSSRKREVATGGNSGAETKSVHTTMQAEALSVTILPTDGGRAVGNVSEIAAGNETVMSSEGVRGPQLGWGPGVVLGFFGVAFWAL